MTNLTEKLCFALSLVVTTSCSLVVSAANVPATYKNVSFGVKQNQSVPPPSVNMGGCQGCHGAAQQTGRDTASGFISEVHSRN